MGSRRTAVLIAAVVVAAIAGMATYRYLNGVQARADEGQRLVGVLMVDRQVPRGTTAGAALDRGLIKVSKINQKYRPGTAVLDPVAIRDLVAIMDLPPGQIVVGGLFVRPTILHGGLSRALADGNVAVTVAIDAVKGVGGNIVPGDSVDLMVTVVSLKPDGTSAPGSQREGLLYQNVKVLAIGTTAAPAPGQTATSTPPSGGNNNGGLITFEVPPFAAEKIVYASLALNSSSGGGGGGSGIYLALVPPGNQATPVPPADATNILSGPLVPCMDTPAPAATCSTKLPS